VRRRGSWQQRRRSAQAPDEHGRAMRRASAWGKLQRWSARRRTSSAVRRANSIGAAKRGATFIDVAQCPADGALQHEARRATGGVVAGDCGLNCVGDGVHHRVHGGSSGFRHQWLPCRSPGRSPARSPASSRSLLVASVVRPSMRA